MLTQPPPGRLMPLQTPAASHVIRVSQVEPQSVPAGTSTHVPVAGLQTRQLPRSVPQLTGAGGWGQAPSRQSAQVWHPL
jgi:hypothetical protein